MAFKDLFRKKEKEERPINMTTLIMVRLLAVGYCLYCLWQIIQMYIAGGEEAPSIWLLLLGILVLGGGSVFVAIVTVRKVLQLKAAERELLDAEDAELARLAAESEEDSEAEEEDITDEEDFEEEA